jgi:crotonobetainyl-CoA:carnitine CoA-transferase CaiB-like acyl-CoA transferase
VFERLVQAMGQPQLASDPRFAEATQRSANHDAIDDLIAQWTTTKPLAELERILEQAAVPATRIYTIADIFADPHYQARGSIAQAPDAQLGTVAMANVVPRLSETPGAVRFAGHRTGEDTREVLRTILGLDDDHLDSLERAGVIACAAPAHA